MRTLRTLRTLRSLEPVTTALLLGLLAGCATGRGLTTDESVARLEQQRQANPGSIAVNRSLGIEYYKAHRFADARTTLEGVLKSEPRDGTASLYLGLSDEALGDLGAARTAYSAYIEFGRTSRVRSQLQDRLAALARKELEADAKATVAQEATLSALPGLPGTVAVMPLRFSGADSTLKPLERGMADMLTTDLARSSSLTLVERSRMQAVLDELQLQQGGATEGTTNARVGKLLRAGRVVQGTIAQLPGSNVRVDAAVVDVPTSQVQGSVNSTDQLEEIFNIEKKLALDLFTQLGVTLTVAERNLIEQRPTRSLSAFLAYSNGLVAEDGGRFDDASRFFRDAVRLDPGFGAAQLKSSAATSAAAGTRVNAASVESSLKGTREGAVVGAAGVGALQTSVNGGVNTTAQATAGDLNPSTTGAATGAAGNAGAPGAKDPVSAGTGSDNPTGTAKVTIVITRPKTP